MLPFLVVQPPHHAIAAAALVILHEIHRAHQRVEILLIVTLEEIPSCIFENARLYNHHAGYIGFCNLHFYLDNLSIHSRRESCHQGMLTPNVCFTRFLSSTE